MMQQRVFGSETELGIRIAFDGPPLLASENQLAEWKPRFSTPSDGAVIRLILRDRPTELIGLYDDIDPMLAYGALALINGGKLYQDCGHPEYCTPELVDLDDIFPYEVAGERIMKQIVAKAIADKKFHQVIISKEVTDERNNAWGYHENYLTLRDKMDPNLAFGKHRKQYCLFGAHLLSRSLYTGNGGNAVYFREHGQKAFQYVMAPKMTLLTHDMDAGTVMEKPLINLRDRPYTEDTYTRQHVVCGAPNMSPWATKMKFGTTALVLSAIEYGLTTNYDLSTIFSMHHTAKLIAEDTTARAVVPVQGGTIRGTDIQYELLEMAHEVGERRDLTSQEQQVLAEWERVLQGLHRDPLSVANEVEWVLKMKLGAMDGPRARGWTAIQEGRNVADILREKNWAEWMPTERRIQEAMVHAPQNTRAKLREQFVRKFGNIFPGLLHAGWDDMTLYSDGKPGSAVEHTSIDILDPWQTGSKELDALIASYS
jgi:hypothetical protein